MCASFTFAPPGWAVTEKWIYGWRRWKFLAICRHSEITWNMSIISDKLYVWNECLSLYDVEMIQFLMYLINTNVCLPFLLQSFLLLTCTSTWEFWANCRHSLTHLITLDAFVSWSGFHGFSHSCSSDICACESHDPPTHAASSLAGHWSFFSLNVTISISTQTFFFLLKKKHFASSSPIILIQQKSLKPL